MIPTAVHGVSEWKQHHVRAGSFWLDTDDAITPDLAKLHRRQIEPWLAAICQSEHVSLLVGNGLTTAIAHAAEIRPATMARATFTTKYSEFIRKAADASAVATKRGKANIEDDLRIASIVREALAIIKDPEADGLGGDIELALKNLLLAILATESGLEKHFASTPGSRAYELLTGFLLTFASRAASRERLHLFTTNYDRLLEYASDELGLRLLDRFVGTLNPSFRSSRMDVDLHYNPPGIRGEPRFLEGVSRYTKLHGSIDWRASAGAISRNHLPFGAPEEHPLLQRKLADSLLIYPNAAKDVETLAYPYAELFRDFAASICRPNSVLVTYGYGFGDDHINRIIADSLTIPSTHLVIISYNTADERIPNFCENVAREAQLTLLIGDHFGNLNNLVDHYLPKPAIDYISIRRADLLKRRASPATAQENSQADGVSDNGTTE